MSRKSIDFRLFYNRNNEPRLSVSEGMNKSYSIKVNRAFVQMLETYAQLIEKVSISEKGKENVK